jgi:hypothetical protein
MADDERDESVTRGRREPSTGSTADVADADVDTGSTEFEERAASFLDLEQSLSASAGPTRARVVRAETVPAVTVPADYPRSIAAEEALAVTLEPAEGAEPVTAYFEWPPTDGSSLHRLLGAVGVERDSFADLHGRRLLIRTAEGYPVPVIPPAGPNGSRYGLGGILGGQLVNLAVLVGGVIGALAPLSVFASLLVVNLLVLPTATYLDGWYIKGTTTWDQAPSFWATLQLFPLVNLAVTLSYLRSRRQAETLAG